ncbi:Hypothetical predicted protein, partial [Olea europaea subsp. europaea]
MNEEPDYTRWDRLSPEDRDMLVDCVKRQPTLYDNKLIGYSQSRVRDSCWSTISAEIAAKSGTHFPSGRTKGSRLLVGKEELPAQVQGPNLGRVLKKSKPGLVRSYKKRNQEDIRKIRTIRDNQKIQQTLSNAQDAPVGETRQSSYNNEDEYASPQPMEYLDVPKTSETEKSYCREN